MLIACDLEDYKEKATDFLSKMDFDIFEMEDIERLDDRLQNFEVDKAITDLAESVRVQQTPQISTLHIFDRDNL